jgi:hypothetical protein
MSHGHGQFAEMGGNNEDLEGPSKREPDGSHIGFSWLRERLENSNSVLLRIPIEIHDSGHGQKLIRMDSERLPEELAVTSQDIESLRQAGLICPRPQKPLLNGPIDYAALQQTYRRMLADGGFASQADLARHLGCQQGFGEQGTEGVKRKVGKQ